MAKPEKERFWSMVNKPEDSDACWEWTGFIQQNGYGKMSMAHPSIKNKRKSFYVHRVSYEYAFGSIPEGLVIDHLCRNRACVNPTHLEPVTHRENLLRGETLLAKNAAKTHCPKGHEYTPENTYIEKAKHGPKRHCRICRAASMKRFKTKKSG